MSGETPWRENVAHLSDGSLLVAHVVDCDGNSVAQLAWHGSDEETIARASLIVRAVNSHGDFVEAAKLALELIECIQDEEGFSPSTSVPSAALRAALAKAGAV